MQKIKNPRIVVAYVAGTVVPQVTIEVSECVGNVLIVFAINDIEAFPGVQVEELQPILGIGRGQCSDSRMNRRGSRKGQPPWCNHGPYQ
jgi:hypothetical protein